MSTGKDSAWTFQTIARIRSPLKEKFGLPRQPGLVPALRAEVEMISPFDRDEAFRGLEGCTHIWLLCVFHLSLREGWQATVRPPRLGGNERVGVFASRAPYRPNPLALSLCRLDRIEHRDDGLVLSVSGCDLVDGTPVLDIKPFLPYADCAESARGGYAEQAPEQRLSLDWSAAAHRQAESLQAQYPDLISLVEALLVHDPRPAYHQAGPRHEYGMRLYDCNIRFIVDQDQVTILSVEKI